MTRETREDQGRKDRSIVREYSRGYEERAGDEGNESRNGHTLRVRSPGKKPGKSLNRIGAGWTERDTEYVSNPSIRTDRVYTLCKYAIIGNRNGTRHTVTPPHM